MLFKNPDFGHDTRVTFNPTTLLGSAITAQKAIFTAYYNATVSWLGLSSPPASTVFFPGGGQVLGDFIQATNSPGNWNPALGPQGAFTKYQAALLTNILEIINNLTSMLAFVTLAPTTASFRYDTWLVWNTYANQSVPSAGDLLTIKDPT